TAGPHGASWCSFPSNTRDRRWLSVDEMVWPRRQIRESRWSHRADASWQCDSLQAPDRRVRRSRFGRAASVRYSARLSVARGTTGSPDTCPSPRQSGSGSTSEQASQFATSAKRYAAQEDEWLGCPRSRRLVSGANNSTYASTGTDLGWAQAIPDSTTPIGVKTYKPLLQCNVTAYDGPRPKKNSSPPALNGNIWTGNT